MLLMVSAQNMDTDMVMVMDTDMNTDLDFDLLRFA